MSLSTQLEDKTGIKASKSLIKEELFKKAVPQFKCKTTQKVLNDKNVAAIYDMQLSYLDGFTTALDTGLVRPEQVFFEDEFPVFQGLCPRKGRVQGNQPLLTPQNYRAVTYTAAIIIGHSRVIKCSLYNHPMNDPTFRTFCLENEPAPAHAKNLGGPPLTESLPPSSYVVWDRLGRSGRCLNPVRMHFNPEVMQRLDDVAVKVMILPPKGHLLNPEEIFHSSLQERISRWNPPGNPVNEFGHRVVGPRNFIEAQTALSDALEDLKDSKKTFEGCYKKRAYGDCLLRHLNMSKIGKQVLKERQEVKFVFHWPTHEE